MPSKGKLSKIKNLPTTRTSEIIQSPARLKRILRNCKGRKSPRLSAEVIILIGMIVVVVIGIVLIVILTLFLARRKKPPLQKSNQETHIK